MAHHSSQLFVLFGLFSLALVVHAHPYPYQYHYKKIRNPRRTSLFPLIVRPLIPRPAVTPPPAKEEKYIPPPFQPHLSSHLQTVHSPLPATNDGGRVFPTSAFYPLNFTLSNSASRKANRTSTSPHNHTVHVINSTVKASTQQRKHFLNNALQMFTINKLQRILSTLTSVRPVIHRRTTSSLDDLSVEVLHNVSVSDVIDILSNASKTHPCASATSNHTLDHILPSTDASNNSYNSADLQPNTTDSRPTPEQPPTTSSNPPTTVRHATPPPDSPSYQTDHQLHSLLTSLASTLDALGYAPATTAATTTMQGTPLKSRIQMRNNSLHSEPERFRHLQRSVVDLYRYITGRSKTNPVHQSKPSHRYADKRSTQKKDAFLTADTSSNSLRVKSAFSENAEEENAENMPDVDDDNERAYPCDEQPTASEFATTVAPSPLASPKPEVKEVAPTTPEMEQGRASESEDDASMPSASNLSPSQSTAPSTSPSEASSISIPPMAVPMSLESEKTVKSSDGIDGLRDGDNVTQLAQMVYKVAREANIFSMAAAPCDEVTDWMPDVVRKLQSELVGLQFYCIDTREPAQDMGTLRRVFGDMASAILQANVDDIKDTIPKELDMVVSWKGLQRWGLDKGWHFMRGLRDSGAKYVLVSNNPRISNLEENTDAVNVRRSPLLFGEPRRIIGGISPDSSTELLLYAMDEVRDGF